MAAESGDWTWNDVVALLRDQPTGKKVALPVTSIAAPVGNGWYALPAGPDGCPVFAGGASPYLSCRNHRSVPRTRKTARSRLPRALLGRPHLDVQQTSALAASLALHAARNTDAAALVITPPSGRQMDVQNAPTQTAITEERNARSTKQPRRSKQRKKADLDHERGRFRHTIRLDPKVEQKLRAVAEILGIDLNAAIAVCVSVHHHRLTKTGNED
jgi:hypothetical protein